MLLNTEVKEDGPLSGGKDLAQSLVLYFEEGQKANSFQPFVLGLIVK